MHLRTDISYMLLYLPNTFSGTAFSAEQGNITSITLRIICTDQTQQRRLSWTVLSTQSPFLATFHCPVQIFQNGTLTITDAYLVQIDYVLGVIQITAVRQIQNPCLLFFGKHPFRYRLTDRQIFLQSHLFTTPPVFHRNNMSDKSRNIIGLRQDKDYLQMGYFSQFTQQCMKQVPRLRIQSDKGIIHNQYTLITQQSLCQLKLT